MRVEVLLVKGAVAQHTVNGEAVGIRGEALLGDELLDYKIPADRKSLGVLYRGGERVGRVHARDALAAGGVYGLYDHRPVEAGGVGERIGRLGIALCPGDVEAVLGKEAAKAPLVLEDGHGVIGTGKGKVKLLGHIGRGYDAGVAGKGHDAVYTELSRGTEDGVLIYDADVAVFIGVLMGDVIGQIVTGDDVQPELMRLFYDGQQVLRAA